jgi:leukotriene-A4 hydrolase
MGSIDPHSFADPSQGTITHLGFGLKPDFDLRRVHVRVDYRIDRPVHGSFFLDTKDLAIEAVRSGERELRWELDREERILGQRLHLRDLGGVQAWTIEATTGADAAALQWLRPEQTLGGAHPLLYTQCQACAARSIFPCQDTPSVRFTFDAAVDVPASLVAVMGAELAGRDSGPHGNVQRFVMRQSIPSYLFSMAIGHLAFEGIGPRTGVYAEPELIHEAAWEFAQSEAYLEAGERLFGPYLWDRYDILLLPAVFPYGGMENPRLTFLNASYVRGDRSGTWLVGHELAHAWTGNLVTNATWNDFWLNEGPTTYAETRIAEVIEGPEIAGLRTAVRAHTLAADVARLGTDSGMTRLKLDLAGMDPDESYSNIPYYKGLLFFRKLEQAAGRGPFDKFLRGYIEAFRFRSITSEMFIDYLEEALPGPTRTVGARAWIFDAGLPEGATDVPSTLRDEVLDAVEAHRRGERPTPERVERWTGLQRRLFIESLLPRVSLDDCRYYDGLFDMAATREGDLFTRFCELAVRSGDREILPRYEAYFATVGRYLFHLYVFRALTEEAWSRPEARPLFERHRRFHHPHTTAAIERILTAAGL